MSLKTELQGAIDYCNTALVNKGADEASTVYEIGDMIDTIETGGATYPSGYVTSGLALFYDGIWNTRSGHSNSTSTWEDLSGYQNDLTLGDVNILCDCMESLSQGGLGYNDTFNDSIVTIEMVVATFPTDGVILQTNLYSNNEMMVYKRAAGISPKASYPTRSYAQNLKSQLSFDYGNSIWLVNGETKADGTQDTWSRAGTHKIQLFMYNDLQYGGIGSLYSLRIYNRSLTAAEKAQNLAADNARFNLGIVI